MSKRKRTIDDYYKPEKCKGKAKEPPRKKQKTQNKQTTTKKTDRTGHNSHLFTDDNPATTVHGTGFNSKEKAEHTINMMEGRDITYQFQVINTMYYRAKSVLKRTKNATKKQCIQEAIDAFEPWLTDYKTNNRKKEMMAHLPLNIIQKFESLADYYQINKSYLKLYTKIKGDAKALRISKVSMDIMNDNNNNKNKFKSITWDIYRNQTLLKLKQKLKNINNKLYCDKKSELKGLPTLIHTKMIMFGYSPDHKKNLIKCPIFKLPTNAV